MQLLFIPNEIFPHSLQILNLDFNELKLINVIKNIKRGTKNISNKILPKKLNKKLNPKMGITNKSIKKYIIKLFFILIKDHIIISHLIISSSMY